MKHSTLSTGSIRRSDRQGFTLAELLLAMLVFAIAITTILALLARSIETVDEILVKDEAMRLSGAVEDHFENLPFDTSYNIIRSIGSGNQVNVFAYLYRGDSENVRDDGTLEPVVSREGVPGEAFEVVPGVRRTSGNFVPRRLEEDLAAREGRLFHVRLTLSPNNPVYNEGSPGSSLPNNPDNYPSAVVVVLAEYFAIPNLEADLDDLGNSPAYSYNFAVRR